MSFNMWNIILGVVVGFASGYFVKSNTSRKTTYNSAGISYMSLYQNAQKEIQLLKSSIKSQQNENDALAADMNSLKQKIKEQLDNSDDKDDRIAELQRRLDTLKREKAIAEEKMTEYRDLYNSVSHQK